MYLRIPGEQPYPQPPTDPPIPPIPNPLTYGEAAGGIEEYLSVTAFDTLTILDVDLKNVIGVAFELRRTAVAVDLFGIDVLNITFPTHLANSIPSRYVWPHSYTCSST